MVIATGRYRCRRGHRSRPGVSRGLMVNVSHPVVGTFVPNQYFDGHPFCRRTAATGHTAAGRPISCRRRLQLFAFGFVPPVLKPDLHLGLGELQRMRQIGPFGTRQITLLVEPPFQFEYLKTKKRNILYIISLFTVNDTFSSHNTHFALYINNCISYTSLTISQFSCTTAEARSTCKYSNCSPPSFRIRHIILFHF